MVDFILLEFDMSSSSGIWARTLAHIIVACVFANTLLGTGEHASQKPKTMMLIVILPLLIMGLSGVLPFPPIVNPLIAMSLLVIGLLIALRQKIEFGVGILITFLISLYILPLLGNFFVNLPVQNVVTTGLHNFLTPLFILPWFIYVVFIQGYVPTTGGVVFLGIVYLVFIVVSIFFTANGFTFVSGYASQIDDQQMQTFVSGVSTMQNLTTQLFKLETYTNLWNQTQTRFDEGIDRATGRNFEARVEQGAGREVGLRLDSVRIAQNQFEPDQPILLQSRIEAQTLNEPILAHFFCKASAPRFERYGEVFPEQLTVTSFANRGLSCEFHPLRHTLEPSRSYEGILGARFTFTSLAYVNRYFVRDDIYTQLSSSSQRLRPEQAFYQSYGITTPRTTPFQTRGPINLGITVDSEVIPLAPDDRFLMTAYIENGRRWDGKIHRIREVLLSMPRGLQIREDANGLSCTASGLAGNFSRLTVCEDYTAFEDVDCQTYTHIRFLPETGELTDSQRQSVLFSCQVDVASADQLLANAPFSMRSLRMRASYEYEITQSRRFSVTDGDVTIVDESVENQRFCNAHEHPYQQHPVGSYMFNFNNELREQYNEAVRTIFEKPSYESVLNDAACVERNLLLGQATYFWPQTSSGSSIASQYYGHFRVTPRMLSDLINFDYQDYALLADEDPRIILQAQHEQIAKDYASVVADLCDPFSIECLVGKFNCGIGFELGNLNSCFDRSFCQYCHDTLVPQISTIVGQVDYFSSRE
ncbi:MAG: hypothetical protein ACMXYF_00555 [Candidatus Woesearchaeota archaeon]